MAKRTRIKGKGAAIFLGGGEPRAPQPAAKASAPTKTDAVGKATFYLPRYLLEELEDTWLSLRKTYKDKRVAKSEIVRIALENVIDDWKKRADASTLIQTLTG